jgi:formate hydrogenlyase subunit 3/multisubunit Na+/H+ antiporter MnhD subunit
MTDALLYAIALPLLGALIAAVWTRIATGVAMITVAASTLAAVANLAGMIEHGPIEHAVGGWWPGLGIALRADTLSALMLMLTNLVTLAGSVYALSYFAGSQTARHFWPLWLLLLTALNALFVSGDLFNLYVTLELLGLTAVALAALGGRTEAIEAALRYLLVGLIGSMAYLAGVALLYLGYGSLDLPTVAERLQPEATSWVALTLMTGGLLLKTALFPLHFWLPPAHANAPAPVSAVLSALVVKAGFYLVLRLWTDLFPEVTTIAGATLLGILGAIAVIWGSWQALRAARLKLLAAYSTVAQLGYLFIGIAILLQLPDGDIRNAVYGGLVVFALTHGFAKAALFLAAGTVQRQEGHDRIAELDGIAQRLPLTTFAIALAGIALVGLPPSGAFLGKWELLSGAFAIQQWFWVLVIGVGSLLASGYVVRVLSHAFATAGQDTEPRSAPGEEWPAFLLGLMATVMLGLGSGWLWTILAGGGA